MAESLTTRLARWRFNFFPAYRRTGGRITYISHDWREVRVKLPLNRRTRNYVGTTFGGSLYGAVDPLYMIMLIKLMGPEYVVWDKSATIRFKRPGRSTLYATFVVPEQEVAAIRAELEQCEKLDRVYETSLVDSEGVVHAIVEKVVQIRKI